MAGTRVLALFRLPLDLERYWLPFYSFQWDALWPPEPLQVSRWAGEKDCDRIQAAGLLANWGETTLPPLLSRKKTHCSEAPERLTVVFPLPKSILNSLTTFFQTQMQRTLDTTYTGWALVHWAPHTFHFALLIFKPKQLFSTHTEPRACPRLLWRLLPGAKCAS